MKTILICPSSGENLASLTENTPPVTLPILGENFISYWMEHLAAKGIKEVRVLAHDRADQIESVLGDGSRWGLKVEVLKELRDLDVKEARKLHKPAYETDWAPEPEDVIVIDHLPGRPEEKVFESYAAWKQALRNWIQEVAKSARIGLRQISPDVWVGLKASIHASAKLIAPCWIGDNVRIEKGAVIGPEAVLEDGVVAGESCEINQSWVGPDTFVGELTRVENSLAWGNNLTNWKTGSNLQVPDPFLMCSLAKKRSRKERPLAPKKLVVAVQSGLSRPWEAVMAMAQKIQS